ncbi:MAG: 3-phenylpropionate/cinnamic acid dioxygenase subunit beta [Actinomycetota bacterium]
MIIDEVAPSIGTRKRVSPELQHAVEQFYYEEADLLDNRELRQWLDLVAEDIRYEVRTRSNTDPYDDTYPATSLVFEDDLESLTWRVKRVESGMAWAEEPPSRTRFLITNVKIRPTDEGLQTRCSFLLYRNRLEVMAHFLVGERVDVLRPVDTEAGFVIARRVVTLDQNVILSNNLSMIF